MDFKCLECNQNQNIRDSIRLHSIPGMQLLLLLQRAANMKEVKVSKGEKEMRTRVALDLHLLLTRQAATCVRC